MHCLLALLAWAMPIASAQAQLRPLPEPQAGAQAWYSEAFLFKSEILGRDYLVQVARPLRPVEGKAAAIYLLDGFVLFGTVANIAMVGGMGGLQPAYVIGIDEPSGDMAKHGYARDRDYSHVKLPPLPNGTSTPTGEGAAFQRFLFEELRPAIEARYPVDPARAILGGYSIGGLFAAHVLMHDPATFAGYAIASPSLWAEPQLLERPVPATPPMGIYLGVGEKESARMLDQAGVFANRLMAADSSGNIQYHVVPAMGHGSMWPDFFTRAVHHLLRKPVAPPVPPESSKAK
jgi:predicted alpha/beta superfamily hydrolase